MVTPQGPWGAEPIKSGHLEPFTRSPDPPARPWPPARRRSATCTDNQAGKRDRLKPAMVGTVSLGPHVASIQVGAPSMAFGPKYWTCQDCSYGPSRDSHLAALATWSLAPAWTLTTWSNTKDKVNVSAQCTRSPCLVPDMEGLGCPHAVLAWEPPPQELVNERSW